MKILSNVVHCFDLDYKNQAELLPEMYVIGTSWCSEVFEEKLKYEIIFCKLMLFLFVFIILSNTWRSRMPFAIAKVEATARLRS